MASFQALFDRARLELQDDEGDRFDDTEHLLPRAVGALQILARFRPDMWWKADGTRIALAGSYALTDPFPLEAMYEAAMVDYLVARCHVPDDEFGDAGKVVAFFQSTNAQLRG